MKREKLWALRSDLVSTREHGDHPLRCDSSQDTTNTQSTHTNVPIKSHLKVINASLLVRHHQMHLISRGLTFVDGYKPDGRVKCTVGLHKTQTQEPVIVFPCLSYPNGDRLRQAMPEGYQSLSALPGKGLLVGMGLESSFRFLPARPPAWPSVKSALVWTRAPTMMYPRSRRRPIIFCSSVPSQLEPPECVTIQSAVISFQTVYLGDFKGRDARGRLTHLTAPFYSADPAIQRVAFLPTTMFRCLSRHGSRAQSPPSGSVCLLSVSV